MTTLQPKSNGRRFITPLEIAIFFSLGALLAGLASASRVWWSGAKLVVSPATINMSSENGKKAVARFTLTNQGREDLHLTGATGGCSCEQHIIGSMTIRPNEQRVLEVTVPPVNATEQISKRVEILAAGKLEPIAFAVVNVKFTGPNNLPKGLSNQQAISVTGNSK